MANSNNTIILILLSLGILGVLVRSFLRKTRPRRTYDTTKPKKSEPFKDYTPRDQNCPNCSMKMIPGIVTETAGSLLGLYHHGSVRWAQSPRFIFPPVNSVFPIVYACPNCGKLEWYIQIIDESNK